MYALYVASKNSSQLPVISDKFTRLRDFFELFLQLRPISTVSFGDCLLAFFPMTFTKYRQANAKWSSCKTDIVLYTEICSLKLGFLDFVMYDIQHCFICHPSDSAVSEDAGIEPRTVATVYSAGSHPLLSAWSHPLTRLLSSSLKLAWFIRYFTLSKYLICTIYIEDQIEKCK